MNPRRWYSAQSIGRKLLLLATAAGLLFLLVLTAVVVPWWLAADAENQRRQEAALRPLLAGALTGPMIERDYAAVREIAVDLLMSEALNAIEIAASDGTIVVALPAAIPETRPAVRVRLEHGGLRMGEVRFAFSSAVQAETMAQLALALVAGVLASGVLALGLFLRWSRALTARLARVSTAARTLADGRYDVAVVDDGVGSPDEIGQLAESFNQMSAAVRAAVAALEESHGEVTAILQSIGDGMVATDKAMRVTHMNPVAEALTGWKEEEARGRSIAEILRIEHALTGQPAEIPVGRVLETGRVVGLANHTVLIAKDGRRIHIADSAAPIRGAGGETVGVVMVFRDVSESYRLRADLDAERTRLALALKGADLGLWDRDLATGGLIVDQRWAGMLGYSLEEAPRDIAAWRELIHPDDLPVARRALEEHLQGRSGQYEAEIRVRAKDGSWRWILTRGSVTGRDADGRPLRLTGTHLDITERHTTQEELMRLALYDALTGLPNRRLLLDRLAHELAEAHRTRRHGALLFIDLDRFKQINDAHGHAVGDSVLREMAGRMRLALRETDTLARLGGDEFVAVLTDLGENEAQAAAAARRVTDKLRSALAHPCAAAAAGECRVAVSIGVALFPGDTRAPPDMLLRQADTAMYRAKESGRNAVCFFEPAMQQAAEMRFLLENELRQAPARSELQLYWQVQHDADGRIVGAEGLLRWFHPARGAVPPSVFIPLAEETGLIEAIGDWVVAQTAELLARLEAAGRNLRLSINVSARQLRRPGFAAHVAECLARVGASPARLTLEITESLLIENMSEARARLSELRATGVRLSLDDFGTGYSSLAYLKNLPLNEIKIDRCFVAGLPQDSNDTTLTAVIILIAARMGFEVVAEGIENDAQHGWLIEAGCDLFQGYGLGRPEPVGDFLQRIGLTEN